MHHGNGKYAKLEYMELAYSEKENISFVKIKLHTGRHHQIRVQLANMGNSIYGDQRYGNAEKNKQIALWAYELGFAHPVGKEKLEFVCEPERIGIWKTLDILLNHIEL